MSAPFYNLAAFKTGLTLARLLPRPVAQRTAELLGRIGYARNAAGRAALRENLRHVTGRNGSELATLCSTNVANFSRMLADYFYSSVVSPQHIHALLEKWRGFENLEQALARGKGVILVTAHLGSWELGGTLLALRGLPMTVITLEEPTSDLTRWRDAQRQRLGIKTIAVGPGHDFAFVEMIQTLRRNEIVAMLVDRPYAGTGAPVTFFGRPTEFSNGPALLWQHTGAAVIPAFVTQLPGGLYQAEALAPLPFSDAGGTRAALLANTQTVASAFESVIRHNPDQWYNYVPIWPTPPLSPR
jgi:KDO2-lipid IV(A) lauroyltransferase